MNSFVKSNIPVLTSTEQKLHGVHQPVNQTRKIGRGQKSIISSTSFEIYEIKYSSGPFCTAKNLNHGNMHYSLIRNQHIIQFKWHGNGCYKDKSITKKKLSFRKKKKKMESRVYK